MTSSFLSNDVRNFQCVAVASVDLIKLPLRDILVHHIKPTDLFRKINSCSTLNLRQEQQKICLAQPPDYNLFDVSLLYTLIRNLCSLPSPTQGWGKEPKSTDTQISDDIERLRLFRNNYYAHAESARVSESVFKDIWRSLKLALNRIQSRCNVNYEDELMRIEQSKYTLSHWEECMTLLNAYTSKQNQTDCRDEPDIFIQGENEIIYGGTTQFKADVKKVESSYWTIKWQKRIGDVIKCIDTSAKKYSGSTKRTLVIKSVCKEDEGEYQAVLSLESNGPDYKSRNIIHLHVIGDIPCVKILVDSPVRFGSETIIKSVISSTPTPEKIEWQSSKEGILYYCIGKPSCFGRSDIFKMPSLVIPKTTFNDKLHYRLLVWNGIGESVSNSVYLNVTGSRPNITTNLETNIKSRSVKLIGNIYFYDDSPGIIETYWKKNDEKINLEESSGKLLKMSSDISSLTIRNVNPGDAGKYQLTAINAVGSSTSDVIVLGSPNVVVEKAEDDKNGGRRISVTITSFPAPCLVQWSAKCKDGDNFSPIDTNAEEYKGTTVSFPHSVLVVRQSDRFEKNFFQIEVTNFIGETVQEIFGDNNPVPTNMGKDEKGKCVKKTKDIVKNTVYKDHGASLRFAKLCNILADQFPPKKVEHLKFLLLATDEVKDRKTVLKATSAFDCIRILQEEKLFTQRDVIFMQFLCSESNCSDLYDKCVEYAEKQKALCYFEKRSVNGHVDVQFHVQGEISGYTKEYIEAVIKTVAVILDCNENDILLNGARHSSSFLLTLSVKEEYSCKLSGLNERDSFKLRRLDIDYLIIDKKTIRLDERRGFCYTIDPLWEFSLSNTERFHLFGRSSATRSSSTRGAHFISEYLKHPKE